MVLADQSTPTGESKQVLVRFSVPFVRAHSCLSEVHALVMPYKNNTSML